MLKYLQYMTRENKLLTLYCLASIIAGNLSSKAADLLLECLKPLSIRKAGSRSEIPLPERTYFHIYLLVFTLLTSI
jgi:hypothetical protein